MQRRHAYQLYPPKERGVYEKRANTNRKHKHWVMLLVVMAMTSMEGGWLCSLKHHEIILLAFMSLADNHSSIVYKKFS
jgi:hypothetical protein